MAEHARRPQAARVQCKAALVAQICPAHRRYPGHTR
jgi:hypothetical protein